MAEVAIKIKVMPSGVDTDLNAIKSQADSKIEEHKGKITSFEEQPVAFGLKALIATISWSEEKDQQIIEDIFQNIEGVSSTDIIDYRRAIG